MNAEGENFQKAVEDFRKLGFQVIRATGFRRVQQQVCGRAQLYLPAHKRRKYIAAAFNACNLVDEKPKKIRATCKTAKRVTFLVGRQGKILHRIDPFDPDTGVENLLTMIRTRGQRAQKKLRSG